jgi:glycosyltransferase involved in cell wall biosynthesis
MREETRTSDEPRLPRVAIVCTHAIQYYAPIFQRLAERGVLQIKVFYTWSQSKDSVQDHTFGQNIQWDLPLLAGYDYHFSRNVSTDPGAHHRKGINNPDLVAEIESFKPDALWVFGWFWLSHHRVLKHFSGHIPVIFRGDSNLLDELPGFRSRLKTLARRVYLWWVYRLVDYALYVGANNRDYYLAHGLRNAQLKFAPHAIDNVRFAAQALEQERAQLRAELSFTEQHRVLLFCGKLESKKAPLLLLDAFIAQHSELANLRLLMVGAGPLQAEVDAKIAAAIAHDASLRGKIQRLNFQNQSRMPLMYRVADIYCLPSIGPGETWGLAVNEAFACARPAIVSNRVGCARDLVNESTGFIVNAGDLASLKQALQRAAQADLSAMGRTAQVHVQRYSFEAICIALEDLVSTITA